MEGDLPPVWGDLQTCNAEVQLRQRFDVSVLIDRKEFRLGGVRTTRSVDEISSRGNVVVRRPERRVNQDVAQNASRGACDRERFQIEWRSVERSTTAEDDLPAYISRVGSAFENDAPLACIERQHGDLSVVHRVDRGGSNSKQNVLTIGHHGG